MDREREALFDVMLKWLRGLPLQSPSGLLPRQPPARRPLSPVVGINRQLPRAFAYGKMEGPVSSHPHHVRRHPTRDLAHESRPRRQPSRGRGVVCGRGIGPPSRPYWRANICTENPVCDQPQVLHSLRQRSRAGRCCVKIAVRKLPNTNSRFLPCFPFDPRRGN